MALPYDETLVYVAGRKGQGKSTFIRATVLGHAREGYRFVVWDTTCEWVSRRNVLSLPATDYTLDDAAEEALRVAPSVLVVDEVDRVAPNHSGGLAAGTQLHAIVNYGRHLGVGLVCASRRPARVHADIPALADAIVLFSLSSPRDLAWVREVDEELPAQVRGLGPGDYVVWRPGQDRLAA